MHLYVKIISLQPLPYNLKIYYLETLQCLKILGRVLKERYLLMLFILVLYFYGFIYILCFKTIL